MTSYRAHATDRALAKLSVLMPPDVFERVRLAAKAQGLTVREFVGRVAARAGRLQDVELVEVRAASEPDQVILRRAQK